jgi:hypothetical protein
MCWVRPGFLDAKANCFCCVKVLMQVDLPALERPTKAISGTLSGGKKCNCGAVVRNLAVCIQPKATGAVTGTGLALGLLAGAAVSGGVELGIKWIEWVCRIVELRSSAPLT